MGAYCASGSAGNLGHDAAMRIWHPTLTSVLRLALRPAQRLGAMLLPGAVVLVALIGCEPRQQIVRGQVVVMADNLLRSEGKDYGDPIEVLEGTGPAADGHRWWQVRYRNGAYVLVDAHSGWARWPSADFQPQIKAKSASQATPAVAIVQEGTLVLQVTAPTELSTDAVGTLEREVARLNALAATTGLHPLFSVRTDRQGRSSLLYGWQGDRGIAHDQAVVDWVKLHTTYADMVWVDLLTR